MGFHGLHRQRLEDMMKYYTSNEILEFLKVFIDRISPNSVLIPYAKGNEIEVITPLVARVDFQQENSDICESIKEKTGITPVEDYQIKNHKYDIIYSDLPIQHWSIKSPYQKLIERSFLSLSEKGYAIYAFPGAITQSHAFKKWLVDLLIKGVHVLACINVQEHNVALRNNISESRIVIFSYEKSNLEFLASINNAQSISSIIDNFLTRRESETADYLGHWFKFGEYEDYSEYKNHKKRKALEAKAAKLYNGQLMTIEDISTEIVSCKKETGFEEKNDAIYIPKIGLSEVVKDRDRLRIKEHNYFQIVVKPDIVLPGYLSFVMNSAHGNELRARSMKGATIQNLSIASLKQIQVPVPSIQVQQEYLKLDDEIEKIIIEAQRLQSKLIDNPASYKNIAKEVKDINNRGDKFEQWVDSLPYPIATILKRYIVEDNVDKKQELLLFFFEAYAIFEASILSAVYSGAGEDNTISNVSANYFERAAFGSWVKIDQSISKVYRDQLSSEKGIENATDAFHTNDTGLIRAICNKDVCNLLQNACDYRNSWKGHSGITSDAIYEEHVRALDILLRKLQQKVGDVYEKIQLVRSIGLEYKSETFINKVEVLTGSDSTFKRQEIVGEAMEKDQLFIHILDTGEFIQLPPYFILRNSPASAKNACYFYNRIEGDNTRYVSYHFEGQPEDIEKGVEAFNVIKSLLEADK